MGTLIGYHAFYGRDKGFLVNNEGGVCDKPFYLDWLLEDHAGVEFKKVCYDLDYFVAVLFKLIGLVKEEAETLLAKNKLHLPIKEETGGYSVYDITYIPSKYLGVTKGVGWGRPYAGFFDMSQYMDAPSLDLEPSPEDCIAKAKEARDLGARVSATLHELGLDGNTLTSPVRSMEKSVLARLDLPKHTDVPPEVNDLALRSCKGNWVEAFQVGGWLDGNCYDLDISGAYASVLAELYDTRRGAWVKAPRIPKGAVYGFAEGKVTIKVDFSPILYRQDGERDEHNYSPVGSWDDVLTLQEIDFIRKYKLGSFRITGEAWWWIPEGTQYQVLKGTINWLWEKRKTETPLQKKILKRCLAGLWGRTLSVRGKEYADSFFPVWGAIVEANTRLKVAEFVIENQLTSNLLHIAVDGCIVNKPVSIPQSNGLGSWRVSHIGNAIVVSSGICAVGGKKGAEEFALNYDWLKEAIEDNPTASEYMMKKVGAYTLAKALNTDFDRLGEVEEVIRTITIGGDSKRLYPRVPKTGGGLLKHHYKSEVVDVSLVMTKELEEVTV